LTLSLSLSLLKLGPSPSTVKQLQQFPIAGVSNLSFPIRITQQKQPETLANNIHVNNVIYTTQNKL